MTPRPPAGEAGSRTGIRRQAGAAGTARAADALLALGLVLSLGSRLRPYGLPIGPGELCLVAWLFLMLGGGLEKRRPRLGWALSRMVTFWALFAVALGVGTITAYTIRDPHDPIWFKHDAFAYPLLAAISCLCVTEPDAGTRGECVSWWLILFGAPLLGLQLVLASGLADFTASAFWYWDRLRGWSQNPAQLAFLCAALALLALHLADSARGAGRRIVALSGMVIAIYVGRLTKTDTFTLVMVMAAIIFVTLKLRNFLRSAAPDLTLRCAGAWIVILSLPLFLISAALLAPSLAAATATAAKVMSKDNGKTTQVEADLRFELWHEAWIRALQSGMLGLGPGPHLPIPTEIVAARMTETGQPDDDPHPAANGTPNFEAHNTLLDLFTQGGLLAVLSVSWLFATALANTLKARSAGLSTMLCGLLLFAVFDLVVRYPIFWFAIAFSLLAERSTAAAPAATAA